VLRQRSSVVEIYRAENAENAGARKTRAGILISDPIYFFLCELCVLCERFLVDMPVLVDA